LLGQLESDGQVVVADFEAGLGTLSRMKAGDVDLLLVIAEPTQKSIQVAKRAFAMIDEHQLGKAILVANRVTGDTDRDAIRAAFPDRDPVLVPEDSEVRAADMAGTAPFDSEPEPEAVRIIRELTESLVAN